MLESQTTLITILKEVILNYENKLASLKKVNESSLVRNKAILNQLRDDLETIIDLDLKVVEEILAELELSKAEKESIFKYLSTIKILLKHNKEDGTTFIIDEEQLKYVELFFEKIELVAHKHQETKLNNLKSISKLTNICNKYQSLLELLEDKNNTSFISNQEIINLLFTECEMDGEIKKRIVLNILRYNQEIYNKRITKEPPKEKDLQKEVEKLFKTFGYDFASLNVESQEALLKYGNLENIKEIFIALKEQNYPHISLETAETKLIILLINSNKHIITAITEYSKEKTITPENLLNIIPALIPETNQKEFTDYLILGKSDDYVKNIEFLEEKGYKAKDIYIKGKELLITSHKTIVNNYNILKEYNFKIDKLGNHLTSPIIDCLLSKNLEDIINQFIEISPQGYNYLKNNLNILPTCINAHDIVFYNIYASYRIIDEHDSNKTKEGPFVIFDTAEPKLRSEITRFSNSGYKDIPYRGIEEENKQNKTKTITVSMPNKEIFDNIIKEYQETNTLLNLSIPVQELHKIDKFIDKENPLRYNFKGIFISAQKVKKIYSILKNKNIDYLPDSLLYAITYNTIISQEDYEKLVDLLQGGD